jgi:hypothetical protein
MYFVIFIIKTLKLFKKIKKKFLFSEQIQKRELDALKIYFISVNQDGK